MVRCIIFALLLAACVVAAPPPTIKSLNATQYMGTWLLMFDNVFTRSTTLNNSYCARATYALGANGNVSVFNEEHYMSPTGPVQSIRGWAMQVDAKEPGQLMVVLQGVPLPAPYWILQVGPVAFDQYEYAIVSDPIRLSLYLLARNVARFRARYEAEALRFLKSNGFTNELNKPLAMVQDGCGPF